MYVDINKNRQKIKIKLFKTDLRELSKDDFYFKYTDDRDYN